MYPFRNPSIYYRGKGKDLKGTRDDWIGWDGKRREGKGGEGKGRDGKGREIHVAFQNMSNFYEEEKK